MAPAPTRAPALPDVAAVVQPAAVVAPAGPAARPPRPPLTAAHAAEIVALAVTADGTAVASADRLGGVRLWTALDGSREPVVIHATAPRAITVARDAGGFTIGTLDAAGGVHLIRTSAAGAVRDHALVASDQRALEIESTSEGLLILRADQVIELVGGDGAVRTRLQPDPGTHIESLVARGDRVLALVLEDRQVHGRWIVIDHGARWGAATPKLAVKFARAVLSPDGALLAVSRPRSLHPVLIDLAKGTALAAPLCVTKDWPHEGGGSFDESEFLRGDNAPVPLGFVSRGVVACSVVNALVWWNVDGTQTDVMVGSFGLNGAPTAISERGLIAALGPNLAMGTPTANRFLGYGVHDVSRLHAGAAGVVISGDQGELVLDAGLRERARLETGHGRSDWVDVALIDDRTMIVASTLRTSSRSETHEIAVFDGVARTQRQLLPYQARDKQLSYEPSTRLLAASDGGSSLLVRLDPVTQRFGAPTRLASAIMANRLVVVDPRQAGGVVALQIDTTNDGLLVGEIAEADVKPGAMIQPRTTYRVPGELRAVDRAGRLYTHAAADGDDVVIYTRGVAGARLPGVAELALRPNADGSRIAAFGWPRLVLLTGAGEVSWDTAQWSGSELGWGPAGELVIQFPSAVATVDLQTGALAERRCGWAFGLSDQQLETGRGTPSICDVADR